MANRAVVQRMMADGPSIERSLMARDREALIRKLVREMPYERYGYIRRLYFEARDNKIDHEVFREVVRRTNTISLVEEMHNWDTYKGR
jgi:hypothetical protein